MTDRRPLPHWQVAGAVAAAVGAAALASPAALTRAYGLPPSAGQGGAALGWRLFGVRTLLVGAAVLRGDAAARRAVLPVQLLDQVVFVHALATGAVPRRSGLLAVATSAALVALAVTAPSAGPSAAP